ncbi:MAG: hypothetical protein CMB94_02905 [Flammeovirgaceae bacterium]|nr:hypothetical protein [Flammeovirgaceae bacterium]
MKKLLLLLILISCSTTRDENTPKNKSLNYDDLIQLFNDWRNFENPPLLDGAPNYTKERFDNDQNKFIKLRERLNSFYIEEWPIKKQIDWHIVKAEINGYDFNYRVLKPWERDPAFYQTIWMYQSDVPAHEGPTNHGVLEFWMYEIPLDKDSENRILKELKSITPFLDQAKKNLIGNAKELWDAGIQNFRDQIDNLIYIRRTLNLKEDNKINVEIDRAISSTKSFITWLEKESKNKTGPSGIGKENYTWYQKNVHLLPMTWEDEVRLLQRELDRAWSSLKLEEHKNRDLPELIPANTEKDFKNLTEEGVRRFITFIKDKDIMPFKENMEPALREHMGKYVPEDERNFFNIGLHLDPLPLYSHFVHWFDLAEIRDNPHESPIRRKALLYNIFDTKNEGYATGVEEMFMHAGLYNDSPRSKEIVWIMIAQRAARGLGSLYAHANEMTMQEAGGVHVKWTPRRWMNREPHLLQFEQHLYLRQPGYGTSYITGKYMLEKILAEYAEKLEKEDREFTLKEFFKNFNDTGNIPVSLVRWEMLDKID